jgi:hypothetical protein
MSLTTDPNNPCLNTLKGEGQQNECYLILSDEERAKGFVRPYRDSYIHRGKNIKFPKGSTLRELTKKNTKYMINMDMNYLLIIQNLKILPREDLLIKKKLKYY